MPIKILKPTGNARRNMSVNTFAELTTDKPFKALTVRKKKTAGRSATLLVRKDGQWRIKSMAEGGWGRVVTMSSVTATLGGFGLASYASTKAGVLGLTKTLALEGARHGITANAVVAGIVGTEALGFVSAEMNERMVGRTAIRRPGTPEEVANVVAFLCSDLASYVTGAAVPVTGGIDLFTF